VKNYAWHVTSDVSLVVNEKRQRCVPFVEDVLCFIALCTSILDMNICCFGGNDSFAIFVPVVEGIISNVSNSSDWHAINNIL